MLKEAAISTYPPSSCQVAQPPDVRNKFPTETYENPRTPGRQRSRLHQRAFELPLLSISKSAKKAEKTKKSKSFAIAKKQPDPFVLTIKDEIKKTQVEMETAYSNFACSTVPELIDSSIYDVKSIWNRYQYLLRQLKDCQL